MVAVCDPVAVARPGAHSGTAPALPWWPLGLMLFGFPAAWPLGLTAVVPPIASCAMVLLLAQRRACSLVGGTVPLLLLVAWTAASAVMIDTGGRLTGWALRFSTLASVAVAVVYVTNAPERVTRARVLAGLTVVWATVVVGGWLAVLTPDLSFTTVAGHLVPGGVRGNALVHDMFVPTMAEVQHPWGAPQPFNRPAAPFPYANGWGAAIVLLTPVAVASLVRARGRIRWLIAVGLPPRPCRRRLRRTAACSWGSGRARRTSCCALLCGPASGRSRRCSSESPRWALSW